VNEGIGGTLLICPFSIPFADPFGAAVVAGGIALLLAIPLGDIDEGGGDIDDAANSGCVRGRDAVLSEEGVDVGFTVGVNFGVAAAAAGTLVPFEAEEALTLPFGNGNEPGTAAAAMFANEELARCLCRFASEIDDE
jgi:hypothetical protein